jgi:hypothetical protein
MMVIFSIVTISCQKTDLNDQAVQTPADEIIDNTSIEHKDYCGNTLTFPLNQWDQPIDFGTLTIGNDESNLILNFDIDENSDYYIRKTYIYIINDGATPLPTIADAWNPDGTVHFIDLENIPFINTNISTQHHQEIISFTELENEGIDLNECLDIVAAVNLKDLVTNEWVYRVYANSSLKSYGYYVDFCIEPCEEPTCETAYAFGGDDDDCFLNLNTQGNNWGWSNGPVDEGTTDSWPIYAGAGQCDIGNGTLVGTLDIEYVGSTATITYNIDAAYTLEETHLHIGTSADGRLPLNKKNKFLTAPGGYDYSGGSSFTIDNLSGPIWVTAHSVVCGDFE